MTTKPTDAATGGDRSNRERIVDALLGLLAEKAIEEIGWGDIAVRAGVSLSECRHEFGSVVGVVGAYIKSIDEQVLAGGDSDMSDEPARERLFDVLMRRIELLAPHKAAIRSLMRSARRNPGVAFALNGFAVRSQHWMLTAAGLDPSGPKGMLRAQGLALMFARVLATFVRDEDEGLARTMAALDRELARGQRLAGMLDGLCRFVPPVCTPRERHHRRRRPYERGEEETVTA